jgi:hypothetical protein
MSSGRIEGRGRRTRRGGGGRDQSTSSRILGLQLSVIEPGNLARGEAWFAEATRVQMGPEAWAHPREAGGVPQGDGHRQPGKRSTRQDLELWRRSQFNGWSSRAESRWVRIRWCDGVFPVAGGVLARLTKTREGPGGYVWGATRHTSQEPSRRASVSQPVLLALRGS